MSRSFQITVPKAPIRNSNAVQASLRSGAGRMHDRRKGRGGARNDQGAMLLEWDLEQEDAGDVESPHGEP